MADVAGAEVANAKPAAAAPTAIPLPRAVFRKGRGDHRWRDRVWSSVCPGARCHDGAANRRRIDCASARVIAVPCDVADEQQVDTAVGDVVEEFGGVDILINNAGRHLMK